MSTISEINHKYDEQRKQLSKEILDIEVKFLKILANSYERALSELEQRREEKLSKVLGKGDIVWKVTYYRAVKGDLASYSLTDDIAYYCRYFTDSTEAVRLKDAAKGIYYRPHDLEFKAVDFMEFSQVPNKNVDWIDDGQVHGPYYL